MIHTHSICICFWACVSVCVLIFKSHSIRNFIFAFVFTINLWFNTKSHATRDLFAFSGFIEETGQMTHLAVTRRSYRWSGDYVDDDVVDISLAFVSRHFRIIYSSDSHFLSLLKISESCKYIWVDGKRRNEARMRNGEISTKSKFCTDFKAFFRRFFLHQA